MYIARSISILPASNNSTSHEYIIILAIDEYKLHAYISTNECILHRKMETGMMFDRVNTDSECSAAKQWPPETRIVSRTVSPGKWTLFPPKVCEACHAQSR